MAEARDPDKLWWDELTDDEKDERLAKVLSDDCPPGKSYLINVDWLYEKGVLDLP